MVLGRPNQHWVSVTSLLPCKPASGAPQRLEGGASLQRVVDDFALGPHAQQGTWTRPRGRPGVMFPQIPPSEELLARRERAVAFICFARRHSEILSISVYVV